MRCTHEVRRKTWHVILSASEGPPLRSMITLETESAQPTFCEISRSARDDSFSHRSHQFSKFPPIRDIEPVLHSPAADPTLPESRIFRSTSFQKSKMDRAAQ